MNITKSIALVAISLGLSACVCGTNKCDQNKNETEVKLYQTEEFYANNKLEVNKVKTAYHEMMNRFNYPITKMLKDDNFWVCDFSQADFTQLGMGGVFWINAKGKIGETGAKAYKGEFSGQNFGYLGHEIYLLPGQALPEHRHVGGNEEFGPKMEAWQIRYGKVRFFSEFPSEGSTLIEELPDGEKPWGYGEDWFKSKYYVEGEAGDVIEMADPESWHFQQALTEGAIVTEFGTYHNHVMFSKPGLEFVNTGDK